MEAKRRTLGELIVQYIKEIIPRKPKNSKNTVLHLRWWQEELGAYSLADISPALIAEKRDKLSSGITTRKKLRSPSTVVRYMGCCPEFRGKIKQPTFEYELIRIFRTRKSG